MKDFWVAIWAFLIRFWVWLVILALVAGVAVWAVFFKPSQVVVTKEVTKVVERVVTATPATYVPTNTPAPTSVPASIPPAAVSSTNCRDGEVVGNLANRLDRTPFGLAENNSAVEVSWQPGTGFGGYNRFVLVVPKLEGYQVFLTKVSTIHMLRYCGSLSEVETYVGNPATHVRAMRATAADGNGNVPGEDEIGVYSLDLITGKLTVLLPAPKGPSLTDVRGHVEVVKLAGSPVAANPAP